MSGAGVGHTNKVLPHTPQQVPQIHLQHHQLMSKPTQVMCTTEGHSPIRRVADELVGRVQLLHRTPKVAPGTRVLLIAPPAACIRPACFAPMKAAATTCQAADSTLGGGPGQVKTFPIMIDMCTKRKCECVGATSLLQTRVAEKCIVHLHLQVACNHTRLYQSHCEEHYKRLRDASVQHHKPMESL